ncbi:MAG: hypothetical protein K1X29_08765 [Bdellovibrionales bacterium]|nr:hypothetical protein [Bdellovibrionales bacterium]
MRKKITIIGVLLTISLLLLPYQNFNDPNQTVVITSPRKITSSTPSTIDVNLKGTTVKINISSDSGRYVFTTTSDVSPREKDRLRSLPKDKYNSLQIGLKIDQNAQEYLYAYQVWEVDQPTSVVKLGVFDLSNGNHSIEISLPNELILKNIKIQSFNPPAVPSVVRSYNPKIIPPSSHPRLWVLNQDLGRIRRLIETDPIHKTIWTHLLNEQNYIEGNRINYNQPVNSTTFNDYNLVEKNALLKAFIHLMDPRIQGTCVGTDRSQNGAIDLILRHVENVRYSNILDVTRNIGQTIYAGSLVYDWCFDEFTAENKNRLYRSLKKLLEKMEIGWPPFASPIVIGHGNEYQINRDLLSFALAFYEKESETNAYKYVSYRIFEELVPMRNFQYESPRHSQGYGYGSFRFGIELGMANMFKKISDQKLFNSSINNVFQSFQYLHVPSPHSATSNTPYRRFYHLDDGDGEGTTPTSVLDLALFAYSYANNAKYKNEFVKSIASFDTNSNQTFTGGITKVDVLYRIYFLLLNNPSLIPDEGVDYPLTKDFGPILGSMVSRTGWDFSKTSDDIIAEIKGGGYCFNNHQHADAGSIQIYFRGFLAGSIGIYRYAGTDYDMGFNRRSISKSMMRVIDPDETFPKTSVNDGGTLCAANRYPTNITDLENYPNGHVISSWFGSDLKKPEFSYFSVDLKSAYSNKIENYVRSYTFLNLSETTTSPSKAVILLLDYLTTHPLKPNLSKIWQINTTQRDVTLLGNTEVKDGFQILNNSTNARLHVKFLVPSNPNLNINGPKGNEAFSIDAHTVPSNDNRSNLVLTPPGNSERMYSTRITATKNEDRSVNYLSVFQIGDKNDALLNTSYVETAQSYIVTVGNNRIVTLSKEGTLIKDGFTMRVPNGDYKVLVTGLNTGTWVVSRVSTRGLDQDFYEVLAGKNTLSFNSHGGVYHISQKTCTVTATNCSRMRLNDNIEVADIIEASLLSEHACLSRARTWYESCAKEDPEGLRLIKVHYRDYSKEYESDNFSGQGCFVSVNYCPRMGFENNQTRIDWLSPEANGNAELCKQRKNTWYGSCTRLMSPIEKNSFNLDVKFFQKGFDITP